MQFIQFELMHETSLLTFALLVNSHRFKNNRCVIYKCDSHTQQSFIPKLQLGRQYKVMKSYLPIRFWSGPYTSAKVDKVKSRLTSLLPCLGQKNVQLNFRILVILANTYFFCNILCLVISKQQIMGLILVVKLFDKVYTEPQPFCVTFFFFFAWRCDIFFLNTYI